MISSSFVGQLAAPFQHNLLAAISKTNVKLFVPSDMAFRADESGLRVPALAQKLAVEHAAKELGVPTCIVLPGCLAESILDIP